MNTSDASVGFGRGHLDQTYAVSLLHQQVPDEQSPGSFLGEDQWRRSDTLSLSYQPTDLDTADQGHGSVSSSGRPPMASIAVQQPLGLTEPLLYQCTTGQLNQPTDYHRTRARFQPSSTATKGRVTFEVQPMMNAVFELVWVPSKAAANRVGNDIKRWLSIDYVPLHIGLHYRCDPQGLPKTMVTVIAAGEAPRPEPEGELKDGLYTSDHKHGIQSLRNEFVRSTSKVTIKIESHLPSSGLEINPKQLEYTFEKKQVCQRHFKGVSVPQEKSTIASGGEWTISLAAQKDGLPMGDGNTVLALKQQVCGHECNFACTAICLNSVFCIVVVCKSLKNPF